MQAIPNSYNMNKIIYIEIAGVKKKKKDSNSV